MTAIRSRLAASSSACCAYAGDREVNPESANHTAIALTLRPCFIVISLFPFYLLCVSATLRCCRFMNSTPDAYVAIA